MLDVSVVYVRVLDSSFCRSVNCIHAEERNDFSNNYKEKFGSKKVLYITFISFNSWCILNRLFINNLIIFHHTIWWNWFLMLMFNLLPFLICYIIINYLWITAHLFVVTHAVIRLDHLMLFMVLLLDNFSLFWFELDVC